MRDIIKLQYSYGIYKNYNILQESGKNYSNMIINNAIGIE